MKKLLICLIVFLLVSGVVIATPTQADTALEFNPQAEYDIELNPLWDDKEGLVKVGRGLDIQVTVANTGDININFHNTRFQFRLDGPLDREDSYWSDEHDIYLPTGETAVFYFPVVDTFQEDDIGGWEIYTSFWEYNQEKRTFDEIKLQVLTETGYEEEIGGGGKPWYEPFEPYIPHLLIAIIGSLIAITIWYFVKEKGLKEVKK